jgi:hypothetical protein
MEQFNRQNYVRHGSWTGCLVPRLRARKRDILGTLMKATFPTNTTHDAFVETPFLVGSPNSSGAQPRQSLRPHSQGPDSPPRPRRGPCAAAFLSNHDLQQQPAGVHSPGAAPDDHPLRPLAIHTVPPPRHLYWRTLQELLPATR